MTQQNLDSTNSSENPVGNTGLECPQSPILAPRIDWLDCVSEVHTQQQVENIISFVTSAKLDPEIVRQPGVFAKGCRYHHQLKSYHGVEVLWSLPSDLDRGAGAPGRCRVSIPGRKFALLGLVESWRICRGLFHAFNMRATRIDCTVDLFDSDKELDKILAHVRKCGKRGDFSGAEVYKPIITKIRKGEQMVVAGESHYFGSPESEKRLCVYDKRLESEGETKSIRFEARIRGSIAYEVFKSISNFERDTEASEDNEELQFDIHKKYIASVCFGVIDFLDRTSSTGTRRRLSRSPRYSWYQKLIDFAGERIHLTKKIDALDFNKLMLWLKISVIPSLATVNKIVGAAAFRNWLKEALIQGEERLSPRQQALINLNRNCDFLQDIYELSTA